MRLRVIAPVLVLAATISGVLLAWMLPRHDARHDAHRRADIAATQVRGSLSHATDLIESLRRFMLGSTEETVSNAEFTDIGSRWLAPVGLPAAAWVRQVRIGGAPSVRAELVTGANPLATPGIALDDQAALVGALSDPRTLFRVIATPLTRLHDGRSGIFLVQSAPRLDRGALEPGFVTIFVPASWFVTAVAAATRESRTRLELRVGSTSYGTVGDATPVASSFTAAGRRFDLLVPQNPVSGATAWLPWLILAAGLVLTVLSGALAETGARRVRAQRELDRIFDLSPDLITVVGFDGRLRRLNPAFAATLGFTNREALDRPYDEFVHPDDRERTEGVLRQMTTDTDTLTFESRMLCKDGSDRWIEWTATPAPRERVTYCVGRDVTDRRQTELEQAALRRIATLATEGAEPAELFAVVAEEIARVMDVTFVRVARFGPDSTIFECGSFARRASDPFLDHLSLEGASAFRLVHDTAKAARIDDYTGLEGELAEIARREGIRATVASPIVAGGHLWGAVVASSGDELPAGAEQRLADFTELLASAIENTQSRESLAQLADEQAALRRVATLVARGAPAHELFDVAVTEVGRLLPVTSAAMGRFDDEDMLTTVAAWSESGTIVFPVGKRWAPEGVNVVALVFRSHAPARLDDFSVASGPVGIHARNEGYRSAVGSPIIVEGRLWGIMTAASTAEEPLPAGIESQLDSFTSLLGTAISNAESRTGLARLADEQAALRRVAVLVAQQASQDNVFTAVTEAVGTLLGADLAAMHVFPGDGTARAIAGWSAEGPILAIGTRLPLDGDSVAARVFRTGAAARMDHYDGVEGETADLARALGLSTTVGAPIIVGGQLWGALMAASRTAQPLPDDAEPRIAAFTELVATAISNAQAREALRLIAEEQAALRRVATLVAEAAPRDEIFAAVSDEVGRLFGFDSAVVIRFDHDEPAFELVGVAKALAPLFPVGTRFDIEEPLAAREVYRTGRSARSDAWDTAAASEPVAAVVRAAGTVSTVASPITVEGRLWGAVSVGSSGAPLPADAAERLGQFTELVATAIANAESQAERARLAEEQASLHRMATLVAKGTPPEEIFVAVSDEVERLFGVGAAVLKFDPEGPALIFVGTSESLGFPQGTRWELHEGMAAAELIRTGRSSRVQGESWPSVESPLSAAARDLGIVSTVVSPIVVENGLWGGMALSSKEGLLPADTEARLERFTDLVSTAIANAGSREALASLAEEQAALRRVATLVARGLPEAEIFAAVAEEVGRVFPINGTLLLRYEADGTAAVVAGWTDTPEVPAAIEIAERVNLDGESVAGLVSRTRRPARIERYADMHGPLVALLVDAGVQSAAGAPIIVEDRLWGVITAGSTRPEPLPRGIEHRLEKFTELLATAIANAQAKSELSASRRRIVTASDAARRRIERDLHDGTQQRLLGIGLGLNAVEGRLPAEQDDARGVLARLSSELDEALAELQSISRGIHPGILSAGGLGPALRTLARRSPVEVELAVETEERFPEAVEVAGYFVASEALANATKHAKASVIRMSLAARNGTIVLSIRDDGVGGADLTQGTGLVGLTDRVEALGGSISVRSRPGEGTQITAELPLAPETAVPGVSA